MIYLNKRNLKILIIASSLALTGCATTNGDGSSERSASAAPVREGQLTGYELAAIMSGAKLHGPSNSTPGATFEQKYPEIGLNQTKGKATGIWRPADAAESTYKFKWKIKRNAWCEDWGSDGKECWDIVRDGDGYAFYKANGEKVTADWKIDSPSTRPIRITSAEIAVGLEQPYVSVGEWTWKDGANKDSGTYETHYCGPGKTSHSVSVSQSNGETKTSRTYSVADNDTFCLKRSDGKNPCYKIYQDTADPNKTHFLRTDGKVTGWGATRDGEVGSMCEA